MVQGKKGVKSITEDLGVARQSQGQTVPSFAFDYVSFLSNKLTPKNKKKVKQNLRRLRTVKQEILTKMDSVQPEIRDEVDIQVLSTDPFRVHVTVLPEQRTGYEDTEETFTGPDLDIIKEAIAGWWFGSKKDAELLFPEEGVGVTVKSTKEIENMLLEVGAAERAEPTEAQVEVEAEEFVLRMIEQRSQVLTNPYGNPVIEIIALERDMAKVDALIERNDLDPTGHGVLPQAPSFEEQFPEVSKELVSWQFFLQDPTNLKSSGYDLRSIIQELQGAPVLFTSSNLVQASLI